MKNLKPWIIEILLGAALLGSVYLLVGPRAPSSRRLSPPPTSATQEQQVEDPSRPPVLGNKPAAPAQVASLFGWEESLAKSPSPAAPQAAETTWLKPIGFVIGEAGAPTYVFKDTRANAVLSLVPKVPNRGWILQEIRENEFILLFQGTRYVVKRSK